MFDKFFFDYEIKEKIGENTFAETFCGSKPGLDKKLSLVMLKPNLYEDRQVRMDFLAHANLLAQLRHPRITEVFDIGEKDGRLYLVFEYMSQGSMRQLFENLEFRLTLTQIVVLVEDIAAALDYVHSHTEESGQHTVYGDVSPDNILLEFDIKNRETLRAKLDSNGIWKRQESLYEVTDPEYSSPEKASDEPLTPFSDQYSLGIIAYRLLAGQTPFHDKSVVTIYRKHKNESPSFPSIFNGNLTANIDEVVLRAIKKAPSDRYENCAQFAIALRKAIEGMEEKRFDSLIEQARIAVEMGDAAAGNSALDEAIRIKPNSSEVKSLSRLVKDLERAATLYKEACDSFFKAQQTAISIREEEPKYPDKDHLLAKLAPPPISFWQIIRKNSKVAFMTFLISIGFAVVVGMATIIYSESVGREVFRPTLIAIDRTSTPTYAPPTPYTVTPAVTP